jgi:glycine/D-amino acid oxidase-like deaminating enzyme
MPEREYDFIIIGQGLAGSILAHQLSLKGQTVAVIDNFSEGSSSMVAAGIINPITGHRLNITEGFERYFSVAKHYYQRFEVELGRSCFKLIEQTRLIKNAGQSKYLNQRLTEKAYQHLIAKLPSRCFLNDEYGVITIKQTAAVDAKAVIETIRHYFDSQQAHLRQKLDYSSIIPTHAGFRLGKIRARRLVFAEGFQAIYNPWLAKLPFKLSKGEVLTLRPPIKITNELLNWGNWLLTSDGESKLGSNYQWNDLSLYATPAIRTSLIKSLLENVNLNPDIKSDIQTEVLAHEVGIRPTTLRRKPFVGELSNLRNSFCFNGFGSKGCLLIPYYAQLLCEHLLEYKPLPEELSEWI